MNRSEPLLKPRTPDTMTPKEIVVKFADAIEQFEPIDGQPSDTDLTRILEVVAPLLLQIPYNETGGTHNPIGLIWTVAVYTTRYGAEFVKPKIVGAYDATINNMRQCHGRCPLAHRSST